MLDVVERVCERAIIDRAVDYCGPLSYAAQGNRLLRNLGGLKFEAVTSRGHPVVLV